MKKKWENEIEKIVKKRFGKQDFWKGMAEDLKRITPENFTLEDAKKLDEFSNKLIEEAMKLPDPSPSEQAVFHIAFSKILSELPIHDAMMVAFNIGRLKGDEE